MTTCLIVTGSHSAGALLSWGVRARGAAAFSGEAEANDLHWAKSTLTQRVLVFLICSIAGDIRLQWPWGAKPPFFLSIFLALPPFLALLCGQHGS